MNATDFLWMTAPKLIFIWKIFHQLSFRRRLIASGQMEATQWTGTEKNCCKSRLVIQKTWHWVEIWVGNAVAGAFEKKMSTSLCNEVIIYRATSAKVLRHRKLKFEFYQIRISVFEVHVFWEECWNTCV